MGRPILVDEDRLRKELQYAPEQNVERCIDRLRLDHDFRILDDHEWEEIQDVDWPEDTPVWVAFEERVRFARTVNATSGVFVRRLLPEDEE